MKGVQGSVEGEWKIRWRSNRGVGRRIRERWRQRDKWMGNGAEDKGGVEGRMERR